MKKNHMLIFMSIIVVIIIIIIISILLIRKDNISNINGEEENYLMEYVEDENYLTVEEEKSKTMYELLNEIINNSNENYILIKEIYKCNLPKIQAYAIYAKQNDSDKYILVYLDSTNYTYKIENIEQEDYTKLKDNIIDSKYVISDYIQPNGSNSYSLGVLTDKDFATIYYDIIKNLINSNENELYNILNKEYKEKRFPDNSSFANYCTNMKDLLQDTYITKYNKEVENGVEIYTCIDNIENTFIIKVYSNVNFEIQLDDYTIETEDFITKYNSASEKSKVVTDVDKVMKMINSKDYQSLYNLLNETYRSTNFKTLESFVNYINTTFFDVNYYTISNVSEQGPYYVVTIENKSSNAASADSKENKIIISLGEGTNFTMSFALE